MLCRAAKIPKVHNANVKLQLLPSGTLANQRRPQILRLLTFFFFNLSQLHLYGFQRQGTKHYKSTLSHLQMNANAFKSSTVRLSRPSVLDLDKSNEPFSTKIVEVCNVLDIKLRPPGLYFLPKSTEESNVGKYGPREEWALRWLLKNFQSADWQPGRYGFSYCRSSLFENGG